MNFEYKDWFDYDRVEDAKAESSLVAETAMIEVERALDCIPPGTPVFIRLHVCIEGAEGYNHVTKDDDDVEVYDDPEID